MGGGQYVVAVDDVDRAALQRGCRWEGVAMGKSCVELQTSECCNRQTIAIFTGGMHCVAMGERGCVATNVQGDVATDDGRGSVATNGWWGVATNVRGGVATNGWGSIATNGRRDVATDGRKVLQRMGEVRWERCNRTLQYFTVDGLP